MVGRQVTAVASGSGWVLVDPEDFKSFCRALITSEVGSIPTRSRQTSNMTMHMIRSVILAVIAVVTMIPQAGMCAGLVRIGCLPGSACRGALVQAPPAEAAPEKETAPDDTLRGAPVVSAVVWKGPSPKGAALRSVFYPGWGQLANGKVYKACAVFGVETYFLGVAVLSGRRAQDLLDSSAYVTSGAELADLESRYQRYVDRRNTYLWWSGVAILYSMLDAYVDASLAGVGQGMSNPPLVFLESGAGEDGAIRLGVRARF
jgi:hypothetical protein